MKPTHRNIMEARRAVMDAVQSSTKAFTVEDIHRAANVGPVPVKFFLYGLEARGYLTAGRWNGKLYFARTAKLGSCPNIYSSIPADTVAWSDVLPSLPHTWQTC